MEAVGQLTGGIAHDFNNILTVITGTIEILAEAVEKEPQLAAITRMIDEAASRGADLTQHLLAFARKQPLQPRETDVNTLIIDTAKLLRPTLGEQIEIESVFRRRSMHGDRRSQPAGDRHSQSRAQLPRRDAQWRQAHPRNQHGLSRRKLRQHARRRAARTLCADCRERHRSRHSRRHPRQGVQPVLYVEGSRQRHRPRPQHGLWFREAVRRTHQDLQRGGPRHHDQDVSAAGHRSPVRGRRRCRGGRRGRP